MTAEQVDALLDREELLGAMEAALIDFSAGRVKQPVRTIVPIAEYRGFFGLMPAVYGEIFGAKLVTLFPRNADRSMHTHNAVIHLFRSDTGEPIAALDGRVITAWRTAAVSAVATRCLANPDARTLCILGSGVQARTHVDMLRRVRDFEDIRIWGRTPDHAAALAEEVGGRAMNAEEAVRGADVVVTATMATKPILRGSWLKTGVHVNAVGAVGPTARELDDAVLSGSALIVESREAAVVESAEVTQSRTPIYAELGEILGNAKEVPRSDRTVFKSLGIAIEDVAAARLVYERSMR